ncbi:MAG TPA: hemerythrin domain-containing protein [Arenicellales bacterium]|nr:hemerythrin domain-containing protein [Arenicellales bacterium]
MSNLVEQIHEDHESIAKVLDLIEQQIDVARQEETPDLELLEDAVHYMINYSDLVHHPKEDAMFEKLVEKEPGSAEQVKVLLSEHESLATMSGELLDIVKAAEYGDFVLREEVIRRGTEYVDAQRSHMDAEEVGPLKLARAVLTDADLAQIDAAYASQHDPLMTDSLKEEYAALHRSLFD